MAYYRKKYKRKNFAQKVHSNSTLRWFDSQKKRLDQIILDSQKNISLTLHLKNSIPESLQRDEEAMISKIARHKTNKPKGALNMIFSGPRKEWEITLQNLDEALKGQRRKWILSGYLKGYRELQESWLSFNQINLKDKLETRIRGFENQIESAQDDLELIKVKHEKLRALDARKQSDKATLAKVKKKSRSLADEIKKRLIIPLHCPYCENDIGEKPHADHIYPLSHGGKETVSNMIYVCAPCNLKKSDKTLFEFCEISNFNFTKIAFRLRKDGKKI